MFDTGLFMYLVLKISERAPTDFFQQWLNSNGLTHLKKRNNNVVVCYLLKQTKNILYSSENDKTQEYEDDFWNQVITLISRMIR